VEQDKRDRIVSCKHSAGRTGVEQAADLSPCFKIVNRQQQIATLVNESTVSKTNLVKMFAVAHDKYGLTLKPTKKDAVVDCLACAPQTATKAFTQHNIQKGFLANGKIDKVSKSVPDLKVMIGGTLGREMQKTEWDLCQRTIVPLCQMRCSCLCRGWNKCTESLGMLLPIPG
jgi:hypothetical protein